MIGKEVVHAAVRGISPRHALAAEKDVFLPAGGRAAQITFRQRACSSVQRSTRFFDAIAIAIIGVSDSTCRNQPILGVVGVTWHCHLRSRSQRHRNRSRWVDSSYSLGHSKARSWSCRNAVSIRQVTPGVNGEILAPARSGRVGMIAPRKGGRPKNSASDSRQRFAPARTTMP